MATMSELKSFVQRIVQDSYFDDDVLNYLNQAQMEVAGGMQSALGDWITPPLPELLTINTVTTDSEDAAYTTYESIKTLISSGDTLVFTYNNIEISISISGDYSTLQSDIDTGLVLNDFLAESVIVSWEDNDLILTCSGSDLSSDTIIGGLYTDTDTSNTVTPTNTAYAAPLPYVSMPDNFQRYLQFVAAPGGYEIDIEENFILFSETYPLLDRSGLVTAAIEKGNRLYYQGIPTTATNLTVHYYRFPVDMTLVSDEPDGIPSHLQKSLLVNHACWKIFELIEDGIEGPGQNTERYMNLFFQALKVLELTVPYPTRGIDLTND